MYHQTILLCEFIMWQHMAFVISVVLLGFSGGVLALFLRGIHAGQGAVAGFCFVSALAVLQAWMVASEIAKARRLSGKTRNACYRGAQAKFRSVSLVGLCAIVGVLPFALTGASSGAPGRFATVTLGGVMFSTIAALTVMPVLIAWIAE
ncbi:MAG: efflux RND transporter permease subunit [Candidatus Sulfotelmatobacter sp.]